MMEQVELGFDELSTRDRLFSSSIENNQWVLYHATSSLVDGDIEAHGFAGHCSLVSTDHVNQLTSLYRRINWAGVDPNGYLALSTFTLHRSGLHGSRTWFRETSMRSLLYAQRSFAGGEWATSFRLAYQDLIDLLGSEAVREHHLHKQISTCKQLVEMGGAPSRVIRVDVARLTEALEPLRAVAKTCFELVEQYRYGVVYAVKFLESDVSALTNLDGSGILHEGLLAPDRIVGKARLDLGDREAPRTDDIDKMTIWNKGPLALKIRPVMRIDARITEFTTTKGVNWRWLGDDLSLQIAREFGCSSVLEMLDSGKINYNE